MSVEQIIRDTLLPLGLPVENSVYHGEAEQYFVFSVSSMGDLYGDDMPQYERHLVAVHLFAPLDGNVNQLVRSAKKALADAGFTWPSTVNASDENGRHIVLECEIELEVDSNEI